HPAVKAAGTLHAQVDLPIGANHPVKRWAQTMDVEGIVESAGAEMDSVAHRSCCRGPASRGEREELGELGSELVVVGLGCGYQKRHAAMLAGNVRAGRGQPVEPAPAD